MVKGDDAGTNHWAIKVGNAQVRRACRRRSTARGRARATTRCARRARSASAPAATTATPPQGNWFEGVMTAAYSSDAADNAVQANIVSVYGQ